MHAHTHTPAKICLQNRGGDESETSTTTHMLFPEAHDHLSAVSVESVVRCVHAVLEIIAIITHTHIHWHTHSYTVLTCGKEQTKRKDNYSKRKIKKKNTASEKQKKLAKNMFKTFSLYFAFAGSHATPPSPLPSPSPSCFPPQRVRVFILSFFVILKFLICYCCTCCLLPLLWQFMLGG